MLRDTACILTQPMHWYAFTQPWYCPYCAYGRCIDCTSTCAYSVSLTTQRHWAFSQWPARCILLHTWRLPNIHYNYHHTFSKHCSCCSRDTARITRAWHQTPSSNLQTLLLQTSLRILILHAHLNGHLPTRILLRSQRCSQGLSQLPV